jgi:phosphoglycerate dehydrogenase-like enzyme
MPKLLILSSEIDEYYKLIQEAGLQNLDFVTDPATCDIVLGEPRLIRDLMPNLSNVKWIQSMFAGVEVLMDSSFRRGYILTNARGVFGELMSEYVFGYMLAHKKKIFERRQAQQTKKYDRFESGVLHGKTIGLLGVGSIGAHLAGTAKHFGMTVHGFTRSSEISKNVDVYFHGDQILNFAEGLDYLVCVLPRTEGTNQIVSENLLNALPSRAVIINVGRGNAVDETALENALKNSEIAGAVLDVTETEPLPEDHPFWTTPNLLLTFHTSAISYPDKITKVFVENYLRYINGEPLMYQVDFERGY